MERRRLAGVAMALAAFLAPVAGPIVLAECDGPFPDFSEVVKTAPRIVIGDVVRVRPGGAWPGGPGELWSRFTVQVSHVVRGDPIAFLDVDDLSTSPCASVVGVRLGDRIALAIDGQAFTPPMEASMVAWIGQVPPPGFGPDSISQAETLTVEQVFALAGQALPEATASLEPAAFDPDDPTAPPRDPPWPAIAAAIVGLSGLVLALAVAGFRRRRRG